MISINYSPGSTGDLISCLMRSSINFSNTYLYSDVMAVQQHIDTLNLQDEEMQLASIYQNSLTSSAARFHDAYYLGDDGFINFLSVAKNLSTYVLTGYLVNSPAIENINAGVASESDYEKLAVFIKSAFSVINETYLASNFLSALTCGESNAISPMVQNYAVNLEEAITQAAGQAVISSSQIDKITQQIEADITAISDRAMSAGCNFAKFATSTITSFSIKNTEGESAEFDITSLVAGINDVTDALNAKDDLENQNKALAEEYQNLAQYNARIAVLKSIEKQTGTYNSGLLESSLSATALTEGISNISFNMQLLMDAVSTESKQLPQLLQLSQVEWSELDSVLAELKRNIIDTE